MVFIRNVTPILLLYIEIAIPPRARKKALTREDKKTKKMAKQLMVDVMGALKSLSPPSSPKSSSTQAAANRLSFRKSLQKRGSKMLFTKEKSGKDLGATTNAYTDEMIRLETVILSQKGRQLLIQDLLSLPGAQSVKVRFISAVDTFDSSPTKEERVKLAQKIVEMFVQKGGMFTITLESERAQAIIDGNYDLLVQARKEVLEELAQNGEVMNIVGVVETIDGV